MTSTNKNTKDLSEFQLATLLETDSENLLEEILKIGIQGLMKLEGDHHIGATRNGYKPPRALYASGNPKAAGPADARR